MFICYSGARRSREPGAYSKRALGLLAVLALFTAGCDTSSKTAATDPCKVLTLDEVATFTGNSTKGAMPTGGRHGCNYPIVHDGDNAFLLTIDRGDTKDAFEAVRDIAKQGGAQVQALPNIGDEAFAYSTSDLDSAQARKGDKRISVLITGPSASAESAKTALTLATSRL